MICELGHNSSSSHPNKVSYSRTVAVWGVSVQCHPTKQKGHPNRRLFWDGFTATNSGELTPTAIFAKGVAIRSGPGTADLDSGNLREQQWIIVVFS